VLAEETGRAGELCIRVQTLPGARAILSVSEEKKHVFWVAVAVLLAAFPSIPSDLAKGKPALTASAKQPVTSCRRDRGRVNSEPIVRIGSQVYTAVTNATSSEPLPPSLGITPCAVATIHVALPGRPRTSST
jgi:hypothetical protein